MNYGSAEDNVKTLPAGGNLNLKSNLLIAAIMLVFMTVLTGVVYPLVVTGIAKVAFPSQSSGSIISQNGKPVGSNLIGQTFKGDRYFHGRPSAAGDGYDAAASSGSNLGPTNNALLGEIAKRADEVRSANRLPEDAKVPSDLVTASGSGLDPDISPEAAYLQAGRIAKARGVSEDKVKAVIGKNIQNRALGVLGEKRVNVLQLNLNLDRTL
jgi:K+-transporting ATPase ATPase C chain